MKISSWSVRRPVSVFMLIGVILLLGSVSIFRLPMDLLPQMNVPVASVLVRYPGAGPQEVESMITKPLEEVLATVHNVNRIGSSSSEGTSSVTVEFNNGTDMDFATLQMREKIEMIQHYLPDDATAPMIVKVDPNQLPIMILALKGEDDLSLLQNIAENNVKPRLERLEGIAAVEVTGGYDQIVEIQYDPNILSTYELTIDHLISYLRYENISMPGGEIPEGSRSILVRTVGEFENVEEIGSLPIPLPTGMVVPLDELVNIELTNRDITQIAKINGEQSIRISIQKQPISNTVQLANMVNGELRKLEDELDVKIETVIDQSLFITRSVNNVALTALVGAVLAILILYLFMKNLKVTLIIAAAIPISIIATFTLMYFSGVTLNLLSLGGFALGVGMLVDNAIVVLENIFRFKEEGYSAKRASVKGASEVAMAVATSTFTTVAVFLPLVFVEGITAELFRELALTVTFALLASLLVSLTLVPMLCSKVLKDQKRIQNKDLVSKYTFFDNLFFKIRKLYEKLLRKSLLKRKITVAITLTIFVLTMFLGLFIGSEFFPDFDDGMFMINIRLPHGATLEETSKIVNEVESILYSNDDVDIVFSNIGGTGSMFNQSSSSSNRATINGRLVQKNQRKNATEVTLDKIRRDTNNIIGAEISISGISSLMGIGIGGTSVELEVKGDDLNMLKDISNDFIEIIDNIEGTREVTSNYMEGRPQVEVKLKRDVASTYGLQTAQVANAVHNILTGQRATKLSVEGKEIDVITKGVIHLREDLDSLLLIPISTMSGINVPLEQVATLRNAQGPSVIRRGDQVRTVTVSATLFNRDLNSVIRDITQELDTYNLPAGYSYQFRGQRELYEEAMDSLTLAVILAVILVYMILASQFQSFLYPFVIILSVPLAFSGGILGLFVTGRPLSVPAAIGAIVLAGIVVNNGIVLIDYINTLRQNKIERTDAIIEAGTTRLRPILMTTLTTILGLFPLALGIGEGAEVQAPLATVVIGGLILATMLTLIAMPVIYSIFDDISRKIRKNDIN
ncbi:efflux RND transporter permease subunit [Serpentinicella sp. ANB-PHB4]|uniref:efflux RND transporter permease subunit n=1 Tax=Serpentinicella sp. ANB-PHB4 TaxID=3074076 RepID=UPI00286793FB|nr:efflux RND transporter permease subunit [Serpentinicella sp. ANB-PHB4]MDR5658997.1 efflux RND transporter permease subunit [Serpentinicella sp. ANB-PHB4]